MKDKIKYMKMNKGEFVQSYTMRISHLRDQLQRVGETVLDKGLVIVSLRGIPSICETFITSIIKNNTLSSFNDIVGNLTQEESRMISR